MKKAFKIILLLLALAGFAIFLLFRFEFELPGVVLDHLADSISGGGAVFRIDSVSVRFPSRIRARGVRMFIKEKKSAKPFLSADCVDVAFSLSRILEDKRDAIKSITVTGAKMPRLPDGYYIPDSIEFPGSPDFRETDSPVELEIPEFASVPVTLVDADILDLKAKKVSIGSVSSSGGVLLFSGVRIEFPDRDAKMELTGECELNIPGQFVSGSVHGQARQTNIRPMLQALEISNSYQFIDAFTGVVAPVDAGCRFRVNLRNNDLNIFLDLHPSGGAYRGVPLESAQGNVDIRVFVRGNCQNALITVGPLDARIADGTSMSGTIVYENTNDVGTVTFRNISSTTSLSNALAIADVLNDGTLDCLRPETVPAITLNGILASDPANASTNRLDGSIAFAKGTFFGIPLYEAKCGFRLRADNMFFDNAVSKTKHGGSISGSGSISFPGFERERATFGVKLKGRKIPFADAAESLGKEAPNISGLISGEAEFAAPLSDDIAAKVNGKASIRVENGQLARLNLFAGLTDYLAKNVPGVSSIVDLSEAEAECVIKNGVIRTEKFGVRGDVIKITGSGTYSIPEDKLDFRVRVNLFKDDSFIGKLTKPIMWPFSKLLLEFRVHGSLDNPKWDYISVIDRIL